MQSDFERPRVLYINVIKKQKNGFTGLEIYFDERY